MATTICPTDTRLRAFAVGDLTGEDLQRMAGHVEDCPQCAARLRDFDEVDDDLLGELRRIPSTPAGELEGDQATGDDSSMTTRLVDPGRWFAERVAAEPCRLGRFDLLALRGAGSYGYVFQARDRELERQVAVKIMRSGSIGGAEELERFMREARSAAHLKHPSIVSLYEAGRTEDGVCYLVTEYIEGDTLEERLREGRLSPEDAAQYVALLADALDYAHRQGVIHRDIKPSNVLLDAEDHPHVMDLGLAKRVTADGTVTRDGQVMGTPAYMSPEQASGDSHAVDGRTDIYSLGVVLYEMLTGERPFQGNRRLLLLQVLEDDPRPLRSLVNEIPRDLETICLTAMAKRPGRRYATAGALSADLRRFLSGEPIAARRSGRVERLVHWCRRYPAAAALFLFICLGSLVGWFYVSQLSAAMIERSALESARVQSEILEEINGLYSEVVEDIGEDRFSPSPDGRYHGKLLYPASFTIEAGRRISSSKSGMQVRLYSRHPFPWRDDGGPPDEFGERALAELEESPAEPVYEFTTINGRRVVRYATGRVLSESCIYCHNHHPQSPKRDWAVGDLRGVLEVVHPIEAESRRVRGALRGTAHLAGAATALLLLGAVVALFAVRGRRTAHRPSDTHHP